MVMMMMIKVETVLDTDTLNFDFLTISTVRLFP